MIDDALSRRTVLKVSGIALAGLAGCTESQRSGTPDSTSSPESGGDHGEEEFVSQEAVHRIAGEPVEEATVEMTMLSENEPVFAPEIIWVKPGGSVTWKNVDEDKHTATAYVPANDKPQRIPEGATAWDSGLLETGETFTHTFETEGVYDYHCIPHEQLGQVGTVIVGQPDLTGQPAMAPLQDSIPDKARTKLGNLHEKIESHLFS